MLHFAGAAVVAALAAYLTASYASTKRPSQLSTAVFLGAAAILWGMFAVANVVLAGVVEQLDRIAFLISTRS
jgi:hypothetical protein